MTFTGEKLGDQREPGHLQIDRATNAFGPGWSAMLVGMEFPSAGCWQVTAKYTYLNITQDLKFIVDVIDVESQR